MSDTNNAHTAGGLAGAEGDGSFALGLPSAAGAVGVAGRAINDSFFADDNEPLPSSDPAAVRASLKDRYSGGWGGIGIRLFDWTKAKKTGGLTPAEMEAQDDNRVAMEKYTKARLAAGRVVADNQQRMNAVVAHDDYQTSLEKMTPYERRQVEIDHAGNEGRSQAATVREHANDFRNTAEAEKYAQTLENNATDRQAVETERLRTERADDARADEGEMKVLQYEGLGDTDNAERQRLQTETGQEAELRGEGTESDSASASLPDQQELALFGSHGSYPGQAALQQDYGLENYMYPAMKLAADKTADSQNHSGKDDPAMREFVAVIKAMSDAAGKLDKAMSRGKQIVLMAE
jgi:hypothetical protein